MQRMHLVYQKSILERGCFFELEGNLVQESMKC